MSRKKTQNKTNFILDRIREHYNLKDDNDIASLYNVSKSTVSSWRTRDSINEALIRAKCNDDNLANWIINGIKTHDANQRAIAEQHAVYPAGTDAAPVDIGGLIQQIDKILRGENKYRDVLLAYLHTVCDEIEKPKKPDDPPEAASSGSTKKAEK